MDGRFPLQSFSAYGVTECRCFRCFCGSPISEFLTFVFIELNHPPLPFRKNQAISTATPFFDSQRASLACLCLFLSYDATVETPSSPNRSHHPFLGLFFFFNFLAVGHANVVVLLPFSFNACPFESDFSNRCLLHDSIPRLFPNFPFGTGSP